MICSENSAYLRRALLFVGLLILPLLRPEVAEAIFLRSLYPGLDFLAAEEGSPAGLVVGDALEIHPAPDGLQLRVTGDAVAQLVNVHPILARADGAIQDGFGLEGEPLVDDLQFPDDPAQDLRNHRDTDLLHSAYRLFWPSGCSRQ